MERKGKGGRPRTSNPRNRTLMVCCTREEADGIKEAALRSGYATMASYLRDRALTRAQQAGRMDIWETDKVERIFSEVRRIGVNINQVTRRLNTFDERAEKVIGYEARKIEGQMAEIERLMTECRDMIRSMMKGWGEESAGQDK